MQSLSPSVVKRFVYRNCFLLMLWNPHPKPAQSIPDMVNDFPPEIGRVSKTHLLRENKVFRVV